MANDTVLVTGGAGFIGSHVVDELLARGCAVRVYDNLEVQVHGESREPPAYLDRRAEFILGDVRDRDAMGRALKGVNRVVHLAACVSSAQSMYQMEKYADVNSRGTALLLDLLSHGETKLKSFVVASSCTVYGEGSYRCERCGVFSPGFRDPARLSAQQWELACTRCGGSAEPSPTTEDQLLQPATVYGQTKQSQEQLSLIFSQIFKVRVAALRFFGVFGPRQSLSNPYTGAVVNFLTRIASDKAPLVFEDGEQSRDFIHVRDVARATAIACVADGAEAGAFNVGAGRKITVNEVIATLFRVFGKEPASQILNEWRAGDIRHCIADTAKVRRVFGFDPQLTLEDGIRDVVAWARSQSFVDRTDQSYEDLRVRALSR